MSQLTPQPAVAILDSTDSVSQARELARRLELAVRGGVNWVGEFTLGQGHAGTVVDDDRLTENSQVSLTPLTFEAAVVSGRCHVLALRPGVPWAPNKVGWFLVLHPAVSNANAKFRYSVKG